MNDRPNRTAGYSGNSPRSPAEEPVRYQDRRPSGFSTGDRLSNNNGRFGAYAPPPSPLYEAPPKPCASADRFEYHGHFYDRALLVKLRGTFPVVYASKNDSVAAVKVDATVMRYDPMSQQDVRSTLDLVFVDIHMNPILVPANYDGKPLTRVYLVTKHSLKKAKI